MCSTSASNSVESTVSELSSCASTTTATVSASLPNILSNNGSGIGGSNGRQQGHDMKLWCQTVAESDDATSSTQSSGKNSPTRKSDVRASPSKPSSQHQKRFTRHHQKQQQQHQPPQNLISGEYPPAFGQCPNTRSALAFEQLEELMRLCNHEYQSNESYHHAINALLRQIQEIRGSFPHPPSHSSSSGGGSGASRVSSADFITPICQTLPSPPISRSLPHRLFRRIEVPENPAFNLIGRVLGPKGLTIRELETRFQCRIYVRGQGSIRDPEKAKKLLDKPGWQHLTEDLHILIIAGGTNKIDVETRLDNASDFINRLLHPTGFDSFKRRQLVSLALLNGTFRPQHLQQQQQRNNNVNNNVRAEQAQQNQISVH
uniref:K Homology domain-containing protein n=1 Tax=Panagrolaimus sp. ES5 TaxID=591445 RepID=A0AC34FE39_9BILA